MLEIKNIIKRKLLKFLCFFELSRFNALEKKRVVEKLLLKVLYFWNYSNDSNLIFKLAIQAINIILKEKNIFWENVNTFP